MKTTANISRPSYSQEAMRRHKGGLGAGAAAWRGGAGGGGGAGGHPGAPAWGGWTVRAGGAADIRATGERLGSYWGATGDTAPGGRGFRPRPNHPAVAAQSARPRERPRASSPPRWTRRRAAAGTARHGR